MEPLLALVAFLLGAFAVAALLCFLAVVTLVLKTVLELVQPLARPGGH